MSNWINNSIKTTSRDILSVHSIHNKSKSAHKIATQKWTSSWMEKHKIKYFLVTKRIQFKSTQKIKPHKIMSMNKNEHKNEQHKSKKIESPLIHSLDVCNFVVSSRTSKKIIIFKPLFLMVQFYRHILADHIISLLLFLDHQCWPFFLPSRMDGWMDGWIVVLMFHSFVHYFSS